MDWVILSRCGYWLCMGIRLHLSRRGISSARPIATGPSMRFWNVAVVKGRHGMITEVRTSFFCNIVKTWRGNSVINSEVSRGVLGHRNLSHGCILNLKRLSHLCMRYRCSKTMVGEWVNEIDSRSENNSMGLPRVGKVRSVGSVECDPSRRRLEIVSNMAKCLNHWFTTTRNVSTSPEIS